MRVLTTLLTSTAICAALLAAAIHAAGDRSAPVPYVGLTTAEILSSDGTPSGDASVRSFGLDRAGLARLAADATEFAPHASNDEGDHG